MKVKYDWENKIVHFHKSEDENFPKKNSNENSLYTKAQELELNGNLAQGKLYKILFNVPNLFNQILKNNFPLVNHFCEFFAFSTYTFHMPATNITEYKQALSIVDKIVELNQNYFKIQTDYIDIIHFSPKTKKSKNDDLLKNISQFQEDLSSEFINFKNYLKDLDSKHNFISDEQNRESFRTNDTLFLEKLLEK